MGDKTLFPSIHHNRKKLSLTRGSLNNKIFNDYHYFVRNASINVVERFYKGSTEIFKMSTVKKLVDELLCYKDEAFEEF